MTLQGEEINIARNRQLRRGMGLITAVFLLVTLVVTLAFACGAVAARDQSDRAVLLVFTIVLTIADTLLAQYLWGHRRNQKV